MNDAKEEIKARLAIEDVISQYVELKRAGRTLKGRSPWGVDKTPSFMVSPEKGIWHDFSANKGGDIFTFIMEVEGISFKEALEKLAAQAGVDIAKYRGGDAEVTKKKVRAREALELATKYYQFALSKSKKVCEYVFYKRNLNRKTVEEFRIGYAPASGKALKTFLKSRGYTEKELETAGLLNRFGGDMFRGRMMVPFIDTDGKIIGYTARIVENQQSASSADALLTQRMSNTSRSATPASSHLTNSQQSFGPKYLNTPDTILFNKSRFIFGLYQAKEAIRRSGFVVIVEGNMDVISSHQAGVKEAVATSGTAMTENHLKILSRLTGDIRLAYDGDEAGVRAAERAIRMAGDLGIELTVISDYQGAKDPDELIQRGAELWQKAVEERKPAVEWLLDKYEEKVDLSTGFGKKEYSTLALGLLEYVKDKIERAHYEEIVAKRLGVSREDLREKGEDLEKKIEEGTRKRFKKAKTEVKGEKLEKLENNLLAIMIFGGVKTKVELEIPEDEVRLGELEMIFEKEYGGWEKAALEKEGEELTKRYKNELNKHEKLKLQAELAVAEEKGDEEEVKILLRKIMAL
ncbi:toprim domain-containing protein [Candidatus Saccharibacteria bacterium]|nr:toprim domain-containing protein [Candidatus Saccharibacteria bacterium]